MALRLAAVEDVQQSKELYGRLLLTVAGLGGLLYGVDVGIIGGALPYLEATAHLTPGQLSIIVAAVLLGSVLSTFFAGAIADGIGRKPCMILSGAAFVASIPMIALSHSYSLLFFGRLLQGMSGGFIGVVVPLYLAECLGADVRGKGTGLFQWFLTLGIVSAALIGMYYSYRVQAIENLHNADALFGFKDQAWRRIFWISLPPGILFIAGSVLLSESPRWLFRKGRKDDALQALLRSRAMPQARVELDEMAVEGQASASSQSLPHGDSLLRRRYVLPFLIACAILFCNTATGMNSIIGFNTSILLESGLSDLQAHWGYVVFTALNFLMTLIGVVLVDRKGRRFLLLVGTLGMATSLACTAALFLSTERHGVDCTQAVQRMVSPSQSLSLHLDPQTIRRLLESSHEGLQAVNLDRASFTIIYAYAGFTGKTDLYRTDDATPREIRVTREATLPSTRVEALLKAPFSNAQAAGAAPLVIKRALIQNVPDTRHGWEVAATLFAFVTFFALGPGVCVWLALSELMPLRIRSNGMSIALVINQLVSTVLAAIFLPVVSRYGYSSMFLLFAGFTVVYFLVVSFALPETKGKTLEEISALFEGPGRTNALRS